MKHLLIYLTFLLLSSQPAFCKVIPTSYITYIKNQVNKKDLAELNFNRVKLFESKSNDSIICVPYKKGNSFLIFEVKTKKTVFVEFTLKSVQGENKYRNYNKFYGDKISVFSVKRDTVKEIILDNKTNTICTTLKISANRKLFRKVNLDSTSLAGKLLSNQMPSVIRYMSDSIDYGTRNHRVTNSKKQGILFNIDWFLSFNDFFLLDNFNKTVYIQRFLSFTLFKNELIEMEYSNPENLTPIDLKKAFVKFN